MNYIKKKFGEIVLGEVTEATDPCYNKNVWCRINDIPTVPGTYQCEVLISDEGKWGKRVAKLLVFMPDVDEAVLDDELLVQWEHIGDIGVDAGLAGFFNNKPDYSNDEWRDLCNKIDYSNCNIRPEGVFCSSGYGDGCYSVYGHKRIGTDSYDALQIVFIEDEENEVP